MTTIFQWIFQGLLWLIGKLLVPLVLGALCALGAMLVSQIIPIIVILLIIIALYYAFFN